MQSSAPSELGTIKQSGFGQDGVYVWAAAVVHNNSSYVGQTVTVNFNLLDASGKILESMTIEEPFYRPEADHSFSTMFVLKRGQRAAKLDAGIEVEMNGDFGAAPFPETRISEVVVDDEHTVPVANFELSNPTSQGIKSARVQVVCRDAKGRINGGAVDYPKLVPAGGAIRIDAPLTVTDTPKDCTTYVGPNMEWSREKAEALVPAAPPAAGSPEAAVKRWLDQALREDWAGQYRTLVNEQQAIMSERRYIECQENAGPPNAELVKFLGVLDGGVQDIAGTDAALPSTLVTAQLRLDGVVQALDTHLFTQDGTWRWSMSETTLSGCPADRSTSS